ncbi:hypothetical protein BDR26DRAFT_874092 [Obelidium mucronatum]|nr:hypothetical protein BDR26DRAFT_874092 [Obelidium mucronatum]
MADSSPTTTTTNATTTLSLAACNQFGALCSSTAPGRCSGTWTFSCYPGVATSAFGGGVCARCLCNNATALVADLKCVEESGGAEGVVAGGGVASVSTTSSLVLEPTASSINNASNNASNTSSNNSYAMPLYITLTLLAVLCAGIAMPPSSPLSVSTKSISSHPDHPTQTRTRTFIGSRCIGIGSRSKTAAANLDNNYNDNYHEQRPQTPLRYHSNHNSHNRRLSSCFSSRSRSKVIPSSIQSAFARQHRRSMASMATKTKGMASRTTRRTESKATRGRTITTTATATPSITQFKPTTNPIRLPQTHARSFGIQTKPLRNMQVVRGDNESTLSRQGSRSSNTIGGRLSSVFDTLGSGGPGTGGLHSTMNSISRTSKSLLSTGTNNRASMIVATSPEWSAPTDLVRVGSVSSSRTRESARDEQLDGLLRSTIEVDGSGLLSSSHAPNGSLDSVGEDGSLITSQVLQVHYSSPTAGAGAAKRKSYDPMYDEPVSATVAGDALSIGNSAAKDMQMKYQVVKSHLALEVGDEDGSCEGYCVGKKQRGFFPIKVVLG